MKRLSIVFSALFLFAVCADAQRFSCNFTVMEEESAAVIAAGHAYVQESCYKFETSEGTVWCDGTTRWIYSQNSDELVVEDNSKPFIPDEDLKKVEDSPAYTVVYDKYRITLTGIRKVQNRWETSFFHIGADLVGADTVVTDLRQ